MTTRKFFKTVITIEVLSENEIPPWMEVSNIIYECNNGDFSMRQLPDKTTELNGEQAAKELKKQHSGPEFFSLDEKGNDLN